MKIKWGAYQFPASFRVESASETLWSDSKVPYGYKARVTVTGYIEAAGSAALAAAEAAMLAACRLQNRPLVMTDDGGDPTALVLNPAGSISGVMCDGASFPGQMPNEFVNQRQFQASFWAEYPAAGAALLVLAFQESLDFAGGGPVFAHLPALNGPPQKQLIWPQTAYTVVQSGTALGLKAYPRPPLPIWPGDLKASPDVSRRAPRRVGFEYQQYEVSWRYTFEAAYPLVGLPNVWTQV